MNGATFDEVSQLRKDGGKKLTYRYRWFSQAPLRDGKDALSVNWIGLARRMRFAALQGRRARRHPPQFN
jgi:hypothetical protein